MGKYDKVLQDYDAACIEIKRTTSDFDRKKAAAFRADIERGYGRWFEHMFPNYAKVPCAKFHIALANIIIKFKVIRILVEWYRSAAKSVHIDMGIPLYLYLVKHDLKFMLLIGQTDPKAKKLLSSIQAQLKYNERLKFYYGEKFQHGDWSEGDFMTTDGVRFMCLGWGSDPRGAREGSERPDYIVVDDVDKRKHVNNDQMMTDAIDYINEDVMGCFDSADNATERFIYANNNFHKKGITNRLKQYFQQQKKKAKDEGEEDIYHISTVNAVKDLNTFEPTWPEKTSAQYWRRKYGNSTYKSFMREYMNTHIEEGTIFKPEWVQWRKPLPYHKYEVITAYGDLSFKTEACHKAIIFVGKTGRQFHILHVFFRQTTRPGVAKWLYDLYEDRKLEHERNIKYMFEGLFSMDMFTDDFDEEGDERGYHIPVTANKRPKGDKEQRIENMAGFFERRNVWINEREQQNADMVLFVETMMAFQKGAKIPLDGLDACEGAMCEVNRVQHVDKGNENIRTTSRESIISRNKNRF